MNTTELLSKRIGLCLDIREKSYNTITLFDALNSIRTGKYKVPIENIRRLYSLGKSAVADTNQKRSGCLPLFSAGRCLIQDSNLIYRAIPLLW